MRTPHLEPPLTSHLGASLVRPVRTDPTGATGPTPKQARGPSWRRTSRGLYVPAAVSRTVDQRILEVATALPVRGVITGWAALRWLGARWFDGSAVEGERPVDVMAVYRAIRPQEGHVVTTESCGPGQVIELDGVRVTHPIVATSFVMRHARGSRAAAIAFCLAAYDDLVSTDEMTTYAGLAPRLGLSSWTGMPQYREAMATISENVWSPQEARLMLVWMLDAGLPRPLMNQPLFDLAGRHLGTPDLLDVEAGLVGEYDGALHLEGSRRARDIRREEKFRDHGLECVSLMAGDFVDPSQCSARLRAARRRARWEPEDARRWTIEPPAWWTPTITVEQRRALSQDQRDRLLRYRRAA